MFARDDSTTSCNLQYNQRCDDSANLVVIKHLGNPVTYSWYWHLHTGSIPSTFKKVGTPIRHGEVIGKQGKTGTISTTSGNGVHLHFFVSKGYKSPTTGKRLPSASELITVSFINDNKTYSYSSLAIQQYKSANTPNRNAAIKSAANDYMLTLKDGRNTNATLVEMLAQTITNGSQKWKITSYSPSLFTISSSLLTSQSRSLCLDVTNGNTSLPLQVWECSNSRQTWQLIPVADGIYQILNPTYGRCLAISNLQNRSAVIVKGCQSGDNLQRWKLIELP
jgi:hypothetical protein